MSAAPPRRSLSRRAFLTVGAALTAGLALAPRPPRLGSAAPAPAAPFRLLDAEALAARAAQFDALLLPAYTAADLIRYRQLEPIGGPPGRAHDPEGAFTVPGQLLVAALHYRGTPPAAPSLADAFQPGAVWPAYPRLALALALLRRYGWPNDDHAGRVHQAALDLAAARPWLAADPAGALAVGVGRVAVTLVEAARLGPARAPVEGALTLEYDWVVPRQAVDPAAAVRFVQAQARPFRLRLPSPMLTLAPLSPAAREGYAAAWARVRAAAAGWLE